jgi:hypothetical protein
VARRSDGRCSRARSRALRECLEHHCHGRRSGRVPGRWPTGRTRGWICRMGSRRTCRGWRAASGRGSVDLGCAACGSGARRRRAATRRREDYGLSCLVRRGSSGVWRARFCAIGEVRAQRADTPGSWREGARELRWPDFEHFPSDAHEALPMRLLVPSCRHDDRLHAVPPMSTAASRTRACTSGLRTRLRARTGSRSGTPIAAAARSCRGRRPVRQSLDPAFERPSSPSA